MPRTRTRAAAATPPAAVDQHADAARYPGPLVPDADKLLSEIEAARFIGASRGTVRSWRSRDMGPAYYVIGGGPQRGGCIRYKLADLISFLESRRVEPQRVEPSNAAVGVR